MENINAKAVSVTVILVVFTYYYFSDGTGNILSPIVFVIFGAIAIFISFLFFLGIKAFVYFIQNHKIYPNALLTILLTFFFIALFVWIIYAFINVKAFGQNEAYTTVLIQFARKQLLYIAICTIAISLTIYLPIKRTEIYDQNLLRNNLIILAILISTFGLSIFGFYKINLIKQPKLELSYKQYKTLEEKIETGYYTIELLIAANQYKVLDEPYLNKAKGELIITSTYNTNDKEKPFDSIYKIDRDGKIIDSIKSTDFETKDYYIPTVKQGLIWTEDKGRNVNTWIFNDEKSSQPLDKLIRKDEWKIEMMNKSNEAIKLKLFYKTSELNCNNFKDVKYNGDNYYDLFLEKETVKLRVDSIFSSTGNTENCNEKKLAYYSTELNFGLLKSAENKFYIIKPKKE